MLSRDDKYTDGDFYGEANHGKPKEELDEMRKMDEELENFE